jgi:2-keto-4-pentenoate hydratase/2-oxohepta-3-ene-1,7-dioic acid hydratase in catechol pathway
MVFGPVETLNELSRIRDLKPGDMIATGTPSGVALTLPSKEVMAASRTASPAERYAMFLESQRTVSKYLNAGDLVEATIRTDDGTIDLGVQRNRIVDA